MKIKSILKSEDLIFNSTRVKADIFELMRKINFIKKQRRHTKKFYRKSLKIFHLKDFRF